MTNYQLVSALRDLADRLNEGAYRAADNMNNFAAQRRLKEAAVVLEAMKRLEEFERST